MLLFAVDARHLLCRPEDLDLNVNIVVVVKLAQLAC